MAINESHHFQELCDIVSRASIFAEIMIEANPFDRLTIEPEKTDTLFRRSANGPTLILLAFEVGRITDIVEPNLHYAVPRFCPVSFFQLKAIHLRQPR